MTLLQKPVRRESQTAVFEQGRQRPVIVSIEPPALLGFRLKGTRRTYRLPVATCYRLAVQAEVAAAKKTAQQARARSRA